MHKLISSYIFIVSRKDGWKPTFWTQMKNQCHSSIKIVSSRKNFEKALIFVTFAVWSKGQLISKCLFGIFDSSKKPTKKSDLTTMVPPVELFSFIFWKNLKTPKRHFEINWPLTALYSLIKEDFFNMILVKWELGINCKWTAK